MQRLLLVLALLPACLLPACGGDDDHGEADGDADVDADADADGDADGDGDADACALPGEAGSVVLNLTVDGLYVMTCVEGRWRLNVRICGEADDPSCAAYTGGACAEDAEPLLLGDACESLEVTIPTAGRYTLCVEAELVNGSYAREQCTEIEVGPDGLADRVPIDVDTDETFPCVKNWTYDPAENQCCTQNGQGIFCAPPNY